MKCIYCNAENDLTESDIIPFALTGAKVRKRFVCKTHNRFTNDHYEREMIHQLAFFRNRLGLSERKGGAVRFDAKLTIGGFTSEKIITFSDNASIYGGNRIIRMQDANGHVSLIGPKEKLQNINGAADDNIIDFAIGESLSISKIADIRELFKLSYSFVLHQKELCFFDQ